MVSGVAGLSVRLPQHSEYWVHVVWDGETGGLAEAKEHRVRLDTSREFGGLGRSLCPDELFLTSIAGCLLTTTLYFKNKFRVDMNEIRVEATLTIDLMGREGYRITGVKAHMRAKGEDREKVKKCIETAKEYCHITRSIEKSIPIEITIEVM